MNPLSLDPKQFRIVAHLDMDCFYCQVEHLRLNIPVSEPLAVQQWDTVIAVNYAARASPYSIKRGMKADECKRRCPNIHLIHVEVIGSTGSPESKVKKVNRGLTKVSLERYRVASGKIMSIIHDNCHTFQRTSIDEAYLDVTEQSNTHQERENFDESEYMTTTDGSLIDSSSIFNQMLINASIFVLKLRKLIYQELGYTVSAGIACNKMLAKQASAYYKPNRQTLVPMQFINSMLSQTKIKDLRGFGGKLGHQIMDWCNLTYAQELQRFSKEALAEKFGSKTAEHIYRLCRGLDDEPVQPNVKPKSLLTFKSFR